MSDGLTLAEIQARQEELALLIDALAEHLQRGGGAGPPAGLRPLEEIRARAQALTGAVKSPVDPLALYDKDAWEMDRRLGDD